jgi:hypothetical protein
MALLLDDEKSNDFIAADRQPVHPSKNVTNWPQLTFGTPAGGPAAALVAPSL